MEMAPPAAAHPLIAALDRYSYARKAAPTEQDHHVTLRSPHAFWPGALPCRAVSWRRRPFRLRSSTWPPARSRSIRRSSTSSTMSGCSAKPPGRKFWWSIARPAEVWIPRRFVGEVSRIDDPVLIVGLNRELEYQRRGGLAATSGASSRCRWRSAASARAPAGAGTHRARAHRRHPAGIQRQADLQADWRRAGRCGSSLYRRRDTSIGWAICGSATWSSRTKDQQFLDLTSRDDYLAIVQKLGLPASDRWQSERHHPVPRAGLSRPQVHRHPDGRATAAPQRTSEPWTRTGSRSTPWSCIPAAPPFLCCAT